MYASCKQVDWVTTCLENLEDLEMSENLTAVREMLGILLKVNEMPKTVYYYLHICIHS